MTPVQLPEVPAHYRAQLVAQIEANRQAAINSPQCADWSNGVAKGFEMALEYFNAAFTQPEQNSGR